MSKEAKTTFEIRKDLKQRWSPRAFEDRPIENDKLQRLFEAARWSPSASNIQPWAFILGKNKCSAIANEGSLKIKEISYLAAEGYPAGSLKHGPFALIEKGTPVIILLLNDGNRSYMESTINEVKARGAYVITITDIVEHDFSDIIVKIPSFPVYHDKNSFQGSKELTSLLTILPLQLIAYKLSVLKGINPDKPKNLAKVVSVI
jgi:glucosamine--fructose-6-phosphate aminotransferase (isomerizing)